MRTVSATQLAALLHEQAKHYLKIEVQDAGAAWVDLTALYGSDWVVSADIDCERVDQPIDAATVRVRRDDSATVSAAPLMERSPINIVSAAYAPLLDVGVFIRIWTAVLTGHTQPFGSDWKLLFDGRIDGVDWAQDPIVLTCSAKGAWLMDTQIETLDEYGTAGGVAVQTVMQDLLDAWPSILGTVTLDIPVSPGWNIRTYAQDRVKLYEAVRALALQIGWDVRYAFDSSDVYKLTLFEPNRANTTPDVTLAPYQYTDVRALALKLDDIRNVVSVPYFDTNGAAQVASAQDTPSLTKFGRRFMEVQEASNSNIDTSTEAQALADAIVSDLAEPLATKEVELPLFWPATLGTVIQFLANDVHYDTAQVLAVVGVRHTFEEGKGITSLMLSGKVRGAYREWLKREVDRRTIPPPHLQASMALAPTQASITFVGGPFVRGRVNNGAWGAVTSPITVARNAVGGMPKTYDVEAYAIAGRTDSIRIPFEIPAQVTAAGAAPDLTAVNRSTTQAPDCGVNWIINISWTVTGPNDTEYFIRVRDGASNTAPIVLDYQTTASSNGNHDTGIIGDNGTTGNVYEKTYRVQLVRVSDEVVIEHIDTTMISVDIGDPC